MYRRQWYHWQWFTALLSGLGEGGGWGDVPHEVPSLCQCLSAKGQLGPPNTSSNPLTQCIRVCSIRLLRPLLSLFSPCLRPLPPPLPSLPIPAPLWDALLPIPPCRCFQAGVLPMSRSSFRATSLSATPCCGWSKSCCHSFRGTRVLCHSPSAAPQPCRQHAHSAPASSLTP